jgi:hypothetical protein
MVIGGICQGDDVILLNRATSVTNDWVFGGLISYNFRKLFLNRLEIING